MPLAATYRGRVDGAVGASSVVSGPIPVTTGEAFVIAVFADSLYEDTTAVVTATGMGINWPMTNTFMGNVDDGAFVGIYAAIPCPFTGTTTVTVTTAGSPSAYRRPSFMMWSVTGYDPADPVFARTTVDTFGYPTINTTLRSTPGTPNRSIAIIAGTDAMARGAAYISGSGINPGYGFDQPAAAGQRKVSYFSTAAVWTARDANQSLTIEPPGTFSVYPLAVMEFREAPTAPIVDAGTDRTVERTKGVIRTAGETSDGGKPITARQWRLMSGPGGSGAPVDLAAYGGDPKRCALPSAVAGAHVIRYTATNSVGPGYDEATITVTPLRPTVEAGPDLTQPLGVVTRTATETAGDSAITSRRWYVVEGPSAVGTTIGSAAALSWTPPSLGRWVLGYTATSSAGTSDPDTFTLTAGVSGVPLKIGRTPVPKFAVALAFGGNLTDPDGSDWVFTEVTTDVRLDTGVHLRHGRSDEASASQPAALALTLNNRHGRYSLGGLSPHWPNVRQGTPVQVSVDLGSGFQTLFTGYADGFTPEWSTEPMRPGSGGLGARGDAVVRLSASGTMRRLQQGQPIVFSPLRRGLINSSGVVAYWPGEDEEGATLIASAFPQYPPMDFSGRIHGGSNPGLPAASPRLAASDVFACSKPLPLISDSEWYGTVPDFTGTEIIQLRCLIAVPSAGSNDGGVILGMITTGDPSFWEIRYRTGGLFNVRAWRDSLVLDTGPIALVPVIPGSTSFVGIDGRSGQLGLTLTKSGSNIDWVIDFIEQGATVGYVYGPGAGGPTVPGASVGKPVRIQTATDGGHMDVTLGHIVCRKDARDTTLHVNQLNAYRGENIGTRLNRLAGEAGIWYQQIDPSLPAWAFQGIITDTMGPQPPGTVLDLFRDCERTDGGILWDGKGPGLSYTTKRYRESRAPVLVLDAATGMLGLPFVPTHDDAYRVNRSEVTRYRGASAVYLDTAGPLGSDIIGRYDDSRTVNCRDDTALPQYASWAVFQGTVEGYRYPRLTLDLTARPDLLDEWCSIIPGDRIDVINLPLVNAAAPDDRVRLAVEGFEQTITWSRWTATLNTSLYRRWEVACVAAETGDTQEFCARVDTNGSALAAIAAAGATTISVAVSAGPLWTTKADDFPMDLDLGAVKVTATACSGSASPQTFTISPMPVTRPAGTRVQLWNPPVFGL